MADDLNEKDMTPEEIQEHNDAIMKRVWGVDPKAWREADRMAGGPELYRAYELEKEKEFRDMLDKVQGNRVNDGRVDHNIIKELSELKSQQDYMTQRINNIYDRLEEIKESQRKTLDPFLKAVRHLVDKEGD